MTASCHQAGLSKASAHSVGHKKSLAKSSTHSTSNHKSLSKSSGHSALNSQSNHKRSSRSSYCGKNKNFGSVLSKWQQQDKLCDYTDHGGLVSLTRNPRVLQNLRTQRNRRNRLSVRFFQSKRFQHALSQSEASFASEDTTAGESDMSETQAYGSPEDFIVQKAAYASTLLQTHSFDTNYSLGRKLGEGAYAEVMVASHTKTDEEYAVKIVDTTSLSRSDLKALHTEMGIMSKLQHEHIVGLHEIYTVDTHFYYMVMEYIQGGELLDRLVQKEFYSEKEARDTALALFDAIAYCHSQKIAHRDLKPENLLLVSTENDANVKICDFGFAKQCPEDGFRTFLGTPSYVAPEIITSCEGTGPYDCQCDVWSLGVICYILLSGYCPFGDGADERAMFRLVKSGVYEFHSEYWDPVSDNAKDFVSRLLTVNPEERLTAEQALQHPWLKADETSLLQDLPGTLQGLKFFNAKRKFRAAVNTLIAAQRMSDWGALDMDFSSSGFDGFDEEEECDEDPIILKEC